MIGRRAGAAIAGEDGEVHYGSSARLFWVLLAFFACLAVAHAQGGDESRLVNVNPDPGGEPWMAGGITREAWKRAVDGLEPLVITRAAPVRVPAKVDNTLSPAFRPIFEQKGGSCSQASAIGYIFTHEMNAARGLAGNIPENQYPYDFAYNFTNGGSGDNGSMPTEGFDIARDLGIPSVRAYGGFGLGKFNQWISGYNVYFNGMANRAGSQFTIPTNTTDGITTIRAWFFDHGNGSPRGGSLSFCYDASGCKVVNLASGTPEAGKKVMIQAGNDGGHCVTIAGYNDSIRYDYNGDGKYTNDKDITGDGKVEVKDWEIGAFIMVNSWGTTFGNGGKIYVSYRFAAEGMWEQKVYGMRTDGNFNKPLLTYKVKLSHNQRKQIQIKAGYANSASATAPTATKTFSKAFNYSGGSYCMQGINSEPIEIGLDVSDFVSKLTGSEASLFLLVDSKGGTGSVQSFSLLDYTGGPAPVEVSCQKQDVNIPNGTTTLKIVKTMAKLMVLTPNGGEKWERDRTFPVTWYSRLNENVRVELLKGGTAVATIAASGSDSGVCQWRIPADQAVGADYKIRVSGSSDPSVSDVSDNTFGIGEKSMLDLTSPNGGEYLIKGKNATVTWNDNIASAVKIDLYKNKLFDTTVAANLPSGGSYTWNVPEKLPSGFEYTLRVTSSENSWLYDESAAYFAVGNPIAAAPYTQPFDAFADTTVSECWEQGADDDLNWTIWKNATPSKIPPSGCGTGPNGDHTSGSGKYAYLEASVPNNPGKAGVLLSPAFDVGGLTDVRLSFWCHMYSKEKRMGELWIDANLDGVWKDSLLYLTGDHGDEWFEKIVPLGRLTPRPKLLQIRFRARTGAGYDSDICIDDFRVNGQMVSVSSYGKIGRLRPGIEPAGDFLKIRNVHGSVRIFTLSGAKVMEARVAGSRAIDISMLPRGIYLARAGGELRRFAR